MARTEVDPERWTRDAAVVLVPPGERRGAAVVPGVTDLRGPDGGLQGSWLVGDGALDDPACTLERGDRVVARRQFMQWSDRRAVGSDRRR